MRVNKCLSWPGVVIGGQEAVPTSASPFLWSAQKASKETDLSRHCSREVSVQDAALPSLFDPLSLENPASVRSG